MSVNPFAPDAPANKYALLEAILAATDVPVKKRINRKEFKAQMDALKTASAIYMRSVETIAYADFLATALRKGDTTHWPETQTSVKETMAVLKQTGYTKTPRSMNKLFVPYAERLTGEESDAPPVPCFDDINFPLLETKNR